MAWLSQVPERGVAAQLCASTLLLGSLSGLVQWEHQPGSRACLLCCAGRLEGCCGCSGLHPAQVGVGPVTLGLVVAGSESTVYSSSSSATVPQYPHDPCHIVAQITGLSKLLAVAPTMAPLCAWIGDVSRG